MKTLVIILLPLFLSWLTPTSAFSSTQPFRRGVRGVSSDSATCLAAAPKKKKAATKKTSKSSPVKEETFRKGDFVASIQEKTGLTKTDSEAALLAVLDTITTQVSEGKRISLQGFGTFKLGHRAARKGRNPQTGEEIQIAASNSPSFTASKTFKEKCNPNR